MRKRLIALLVITPLLLSSQLSTSHAAAKVGAKCSKLGVKSVVGAKIFTCIKSGNKLVWKKEVKTPPIRTGDTAFVSAGIKAALDNLAQFPKSKDTPQALNYNFGPNAERDMSNVIEKNAKVTMDFFVDFYQDSKPYQIFYGSDKDLDWIIAEWRRYGYAEAIGPELFEQSVSNTRRRTGPTSVMIGSDNRLPQTPMILLASRSALLNNNLQINTIHHVVHGVQGRITGGKDLLLGCWGREGAAQFYGWAIMDRNFKTIGGSDYASERRAQSKPMFPWNAPKTNLLELSESQWLDTLKLLEGGPRFGNQIYCNLEEELGNLAYSSGALLYEKLVGEFGHQKVIDWWYEIRSTSDWKVAFEKVFKLNIDDWYKQSAIPYLMKEYQAWR